MRGEKIVNFRASIHIKLSREKKKDSAHVSRTLFKQRLTPTTSEFPISLFLAQGRAWNKDIIAFSFLSTGSASGNLSRAVEKERKMGNLEVRDRNGDLVPTELPPESLSSPGYWATPSRSSFPV